jgi:hypothetical protein
LASPIPTPYHIPKCRTNTLITFQPLQLLSSRPIIRRRSNNLNSPSKHTHARTSRQPWSRPPPHPETCAYKRKLLPLPRYLSGSDPRRRATPLFLKASIYARNADSCSPKRTDINKSHLCLIVMRTTCDNLVLNVQSIGPISA